MACVLTPSRRGPWRGEAYRLKDFHDELLGYTCAPLPVIRREMLGPNAGPAL